MICKVCGAKIVDGSCVCDLCGTSVENNNGYNVNNSSNSANSQNEIGDADPFSIEGNENADKATNNDPFWPGNTDLDNKKGNISHTENDPNSDYDFKKQSAYVRHGSSKKEKAIIGILIGIIVMLVVVVIILCDYKKDIIEDDIQVNDEVNQGNEITPKIEETESEKTAYTACTAEDIILPQAVNADAITPKSILEYETYFDKDYNFIIDYPSDFQERNTNNKAMQKKYANENDSAILCVYACDNFGSITASELQNRIIKIYGGNITYSPLKDNWFAISINDDLFYHYAFFRLENQKIKGFEFHFSGEENLDDYSKYIDHIYASFKNI